MATEALLAHVLVAKYADFLPLYRQATIFARQGIELDRSTLGDGVGRACWWLEPLWRLLRRHVIGSTRIFADDTTLPVLDPGRGRTKTGRLWGYAIDDRPWQGSTPPAVVYLYAEDRRGEHPAAHMAEFQGVLQVDGYSGFKSLLAGRPPDQIRLAFCWAHCRRRFYELHRSTGSPLAEEVLRRIGELYKVEAEIRGRSAEERRTVRQERSKPIVDALHGWLTAQLERVSGKSGLAEAIRYALRHWTGLVLFLEDGRLEPDTNTIERAIRPIALGRKNTHDRQSRRRTRIGVHRSAASKSNVTGSAKARAPELYRRSLKHSCGDWLPQDRMRRRASSSNLRRSGVRRFRILARGFPRTAPGALTVAGPGSLVTSSEALHRRHLRRGWHRAGRDRPDEPEQLAGNGRDRDVALLPATDQFAIPAAQSHLRLPGDVSPSLRDAALLEPHRLAHLGGQAVAPGRFEQQRSGGDVAGLGDATRADAPAAGVLTRHQAEKGHELPRAGEPGEVAHLGHQRRRDDQLDALQGLQSRDDRRKGPGRDQLGQLLLELSLAALRLVETVDVALQGKLLRGMRELPVREPDAMPEAPGLAEVADAMLEQEHLDVRPGLAHIVGRRLPGADEVPHRLVNLVRDPDEGELAGTQEPRQGNRIAGVVLDPIARLPWRAGRRHHTAGEARGGEMAIKCVAARTGLVRELDRPMTLDQLARKPCHGVRRVPDHAPVADLAVPPRLGDRHRDAVLVDIQANVGVELRHRSVLLCWAHELHQPLRRWSQLDARADRPSAEHGHATSLFAGSDAGARHWAIMASLIASAKLNGVNPQGWLTDVLERMVSGRTKAHELQKLLPWAWQAERLVAAVHA